MQDRETASADYLADFKKLMHNTEALRRLCINNRFTDLSVRAKKAYDQLVDLETAEQNDELQQLREHLFEVAFELDKRLERKRSNAGERFGFSVMFT